MAYCDLCGHNAWSVDYPCRYGNECPFYVMSTETDTMSTEDGREKSKQEGYKENREENDRVMAEIQQRALAKGKEMAAGDSPWGVPGHKPDTVILDDLADPGTQETLEEIIERRSKSLRSDLEQEALGPYATPILNTREQTHGDYAETAIRIQVLKRAMRYNTNFDGLDDNMKESLEAIAIKIGRILSGNAWTKDHWEDIAGYAKLISEKL